MALTTFEKIRRRAAYPVKLPNDETIKIRSLSIGEHVRSQELEGDAKVGFLIGCVLCEDDGSPACKKNEGESDADFGLRTARECDLDTPSFQAIQTAIKKLEKNPSLDVVLKNSEETSTSS